MSTLSISRILRESLAVVCLAGAAFVVVSLSSYHPGDPSLNTMWAGTQLEPVVIHNQGGRVGAYLADALAQTFGVGAFILPLALVACAANLFRRTQPARPHWVLPGGAGLLVAGTTLLNLSMAADPFFNDPLASVPAGGAVGHGVAHGLTSFLNTTGATIAASALFVIAFLLLTQVTISGIASTTMTGLKHLWRLVVASVKRIKLLRLPWTAKGKRPEIALPAARRRQRRRRAAEEASQPPVVHLDESELGLAEPAAGQAGAKASRQRALDFSRSPRAWKLPPLALLTESPKVEVKTMQEDLLKRAEILEMKLRDFGVEGRVTQVLPGPVITMYEFEPASGVKVNKIVNLADDLALVMRAVSVRIVAPIPGKAVVGIEIPNADREPVALRDVLASRKFREYPSPLAIALGKDILGNPAVTDLAAIPHLLIAGATGSGKSVGLNSIITSLLYRARPDEVKLVLIDPKRLELSAYDGIPHLLAPVVTNPKKAAAVLRNIVGEMERRYQLLATYQVRSIERYNQLVEERQEAGSAPGADTPEEESPERLPYIVVVIDELADLMMVSSRDVEDSLTRLAQMARAAGIHMLVATQRPSVDVLTGVIKANFPARISYKVSSKTDSRTIIDRNGSEQLLGKGDLLFLPPGTSKLTRIHGAYVSEEEVLRTAEFLKKQASPVYDESLLTPVVEDDDGGTGDDWELDEKYDEAVALVTRTGQASISMIQRRLRVGYNRAARMVEIMEREGVVGPTDGVKPREVLVPAAPSPT
ncbi:MAG: DNA translocase FtsK [bacterium]|nr:DNA translocase FtsK [bacterium]